MEYDIFATQSLPTEKELFKYINVRDKRAYTVFLLPSIRADIKVVCYDYRCREIGISYGAIMAAASFLVFFRGLPLNEVEIEIYDRIACVKININEKTMSLNLPKCKEKLENNKVFIGDIRTDTKIVELENSNMSIIVTRCEDVETFEDLHLFSLLLSDINNAIAVAFSIQNSEASLKYQSLTLLSDLALFSAIAAYEYLNETSCKRFIFLGESVGLTASYNGIRVTVNAPPMMRFTTPYL